MQRHTASAQQQANGNKTNGSRKTGGKPALLSMAAWVVLAILFLAAIVLDAFFSDSGILRVWQLEREYKTLNEEINRIEAENQALQEQIDFLKANPDAVEDVAREELNLALPGEDVYLFSREPTMVDVKSVQEDSHTEIEEPAQQ
jgi:cell division protein FtsB